jgi:GT2 family glycosyltransferase
LPGRPILGFIAGAAVVRRDAFLAAGGFERRMMVGGEETLLAVDLARAGCDLAYVEDVVAHHHPSPARDPVRRRAIMRRNALWTAWLRRSPSRAAAHTVRLARDAVRDPASLRALAEAAQAAGWAMRRRRAVPAALDRELDLVRTQ